MSVLASIRKVSKISPIPNADAIEVAKIDGWEVVVKKGEFKEGDLCVYFQIDSFLPDKPVYSFLKNKTMMEGNVGYRLRTIRLRGQVSQGLALPLADFGIIDAEEGDNVTEPLGVLKYEKPVPANLRGQVAGGRPSEIRKTDEERIQNIKDSDFEQLLDRKVYKTLKRDGSSMTVFCLREEQKQDLGNGDYDITTSWRSGLCSRNLELKENLDNTMWKCADELNLVSALYKFCSEKGIALAVQGEIFGPGIQKNPHKVDKVQFEIFNIWNIDEQKYLTPLMVRTFIEILKQLYGASQLLDYVPSTEYAEPLRKFGETKEDLLKDADNNYKSPNGSYNEGFVYKLATPTEDDTITSFKVISNKYLLKMED